MEYRRGRGEAICFVHSRGAECPGSPHTPHLSVWANEFLSGCDPCQRNGLLSLGACHCSRRELHTEKADGVAAVFNGSCPSVRPPLWPSGQSFRLHIQRSQVRFPALPDFMRSVVGLKRCPLSLVSTIEELLGRNSSCSGLESREYGRRDPSRWPHNICFPKTLALTSLTSGCCSVGIVRSRTKVYCAFVILLICFVRDHNADVINLTVMRHLPPSVALTLMSWVWISFESWFGYLQSFVLVLSV
jgi:hypothetical protein